jgi:hypothetical protein
MGSTDAVPTEGFIREKHNNRVGALYESCYAFLKKRSGTSDIVTALYHHHDTQVVFERQPTSPELVNKMMQHGAGGDNNFKLCMTKLGEVLGRETLDYIPIALFMTDGQWTDDGGPNILQGLMNMHQSLTLHAICLGNGVKKDLMELYAKIGKGKLSMSGMNLVELKNVYETFADALKL